MLEKQREGRPGAAFSFDDGEGGMKTISGTDVSIFSFGTMQFGGGADDSASMEMYKACRNARINFFDTAYAYTEGNSEEILGRCVRSERDSVYIATKADYSCPSTRDNILRSCDVSRKRLDVDQIDGLKRELEAARRESQQSIGLLRADEPSHARPRALP